MKLPEGSKKYETSNSLVYSCQYHVVFCPKYRRKVLIDGVDIRLKELIEEKQSEYGYVVVESEVMSDHVHLLLDVNPQVGIVKIVGQIKGFTASKLRKEFPWLKKRLPCMWTRSKFISTVGSVTLGVAKRYIEDQKGV